MGKNAKVKAKKVGGIKPQDKGTLRKTLQGNPTDAQLQKRVVQGIKGP